jgi:hypothetical protein
MFGMPLILVVGGSVGAIALGLWLLARQMRYGTSAGSQPAHARVEVPPAPASTESFAENNTANPPSMNNEVPAARSDDVLHVHADATNAAEPVAPDAVVDRASVPSNQEDTQGATRNDLFDATDSWVATDDRATEIAAPFADPGRSDCDASVHGPLDSSDGSEVKAADTAVPLDDNSSSGKEDAASLTAAYHISTSSMTAVEVESASAAEIDKTHAKAVQCVVREEAPPEEVDYPNVQALQHPLGELVAAISVTDEKADEPYGGRDPNPNAQQLATEVGSARVSEARAMDTAEVLAGGGELLPSKERDDARGDAVPRALEALPVDPDHADVEAEAISDRLSMDTGFRPNLQHFVADGEAAPTEQVPATRDIPALASPQGVPIPDERGNANVEAIEPPVEEPRLVASDGDGDIKGTVDEPYVGSGHESNPPQPAVDDENTALTAELPADTIAVLGTEREVPPARHIEDVHGQAALPTFDGLVADAADAATDIDIVSDDLYWDAGPQPDPPQLANERKVDELPVPEKHYSRQSYVARHRDRRGQRRALPAKLASTPETIAPVQATQSRPPSEVRLRLLLHPVRRTVSISAVLARPAGYPDLITLRQEAGADVRAYGEDRYDDVDLEWTPSLLSGELRLDCEQGYQWLRSGRRVHIFRAESDEPNLLSVGFAALNSPCAIICRREDADAVRSATRMCGSPELTSHDRWTGIADGWAVFSNYLPAHAASQNLEPDLTALDPGIGAEIRLTGVLQISAAAFAEGSPPRIEITPFQAAARVTIDGAAAELGEDGAWRANGWDTPGQHLVDVVPGPSATYRILADPWVSDGWESWDAHPGRFTAGGGAPWAQAKICGANLSGPSAEHLIAAEPMATLMALGQQRGVATLQPRPDAPIAVGLLRDAPAFLISASGPRRTQGRISWLAPSTTASSGRFIDPQWVSAVRIVALRRLTLEGESVAGQVAWRRARDRARRYVKEDK